MKESLRFGLVGYGNIGQRHAEIIQQVGILEAICDSNIKKIETSRVPNKTRIYSSLSEMLSKDNYYDAIVICTPNHLHTTNAIECIKKGYNVLCEKPMALTTRDCKEIERLAKENKILIQVVKQNRNNPLIKQLLYSIENGELGKISSYQINGYWNRNLSYYQSTWRGKKKEDGGILFTQFSHFVDLLSLLFEYPDKIEAFKENRLHKSVTEIEDTVVAILRHPSNILGSLHFTTNAFGGNMEGSIAIHAENGSIKIGGEYLNKLEYINLSNRMLENEFWELTKISISDKNHLHKLDYEEFIKNISKKTTSITSISNSINTVKLIEEIYTRIDSE